MTVEVIGYISEEARRYTALVEFVIAQEAAGRITTAEFSRLMAADGDLYRNHLAALDGIPPVTTALSPLRYAQAVAAIQARLAKKHPDLADQAAQTTGRASPAADGVRRYVMIVEFLGDQERAGRLTAAARETLVAVDPRLDQAYTAGRTGQGAVHLQNTHAALAADGIRHQLAIRHPDLARAFDLVAGDRSRQPARRRESVTRPFFARPVGRPLPISVGGTVPPAADSPGRFQRPGCPHRPCGSPRPIPCGATAPRHHNTVTTCRGNTTGPGRAPRKPPRPPPKPKSCTPGSRRQTSCDGRPSSSSL